MLIDKISAKDGVREIIKRAFDMDMDISGGWGYGLDNAMIISNIDTGIEQLQHTLCSMRTHLELNLTKPKEQRYGGITINELSRSILNGCDVVTYELKAMLESDYTDFIDKYKQGYGTKKFNMTEHFKRRQEATVTQKTTMYFKINNHGTGAYI